jgi:hypothetical protein
VDLWHWNGLAPNRALRKLRLAPASLEPAPKTPSTWRPTRYRLVVGEIESVVQAHPADKAAAPRAWRTHRYELALATAAHVADDAQSPARPADAPPPPRFEVGAADPGEKLCGNQPVSWDVGAKLENSLARPNRSRFG